MKKGGGKRNCLKEEKVNRAGEMKTATERTTGKERERGDK